MILIAAQLKHPDISAIGNIVHMLPVSAGQRTELQALLDIGRALLARDGNERTFLLLFQNNWELRPGGGFIGSYGILKIRDGRISSLVIDDTYNLDRRIPPVVPPPYPYRETVKITSLKLRDSNISPDFPANAEAAERFYHLGGGTEIDGTIAITTNVLTALLDITGPITLERYPGTYRDEDAVYTLENQVEREYIAQGVPYTERKSVLNDLAGEILKRLQPIDITRLRALGGVLLTALRQKDIQLYFKDARLQHIARRHGWDGRVDADFTGNYLAIVDANLGGWKSDFVVRRTVAYTVDYSSSPPIATLAITYRHPAEKRTWLIHNYQTYLRIYTPKGSRFVQGVHFNAPVFAEEFGKQVFGTLLMVPIGQERTVEITYALPAAISAHPQPLKIHKQAGMHSIPFTITTIDPDRQIRRQSLTVSADTVVR